MKTKFFIYCFITFIISCHSVFAADAPNKMTEDEMKEQGIPQGGLQISPTKFIWNLKSGETKRGRVIIKNYAEIDQIVKLEVEDFFVRDDGQTPQIYTPDEDHDLKALDVIDWITPPEDFIIPAGGVKAVEFTVKVPENQPTNGYYGTLLFRAGNANGEKEGSQIGLSYRIGALLIMAVQGSEPMKIDAEIQSFYTDKKIFWDTPTNLFIRTNNTGNIHFPIFGDIEVHRFKKRFYQVDLSPRLLYPQKIVDFQEKMNFGWFDFGKYTAKVRLYTENKSINMEKETEFWVIPWKGCAVIFGGILFIIFIGYFMRNYVHIGRK